MHCTSLSAHQSWSDNFLSRLWAISECAIPRPGTADWKGIARHPRLIQQKAAVKIKQAEDGCSHCKLASYSVNVKASRLTRVHRAAVTSHNKAAFKEFNKSYLQRQKIDSYFCWQQRNGCKPLRSTPGVKPTAAGCQLSASLTIFNVLSWKNTP